MRYKFIVRSYLPLMAETYINADNDKAALQKFNSCNCVTFVSIYNLARCGGTIPNERITFRHSSILIHPLKIKMVEVVGTAPTSAMLITKLVYRHSWKTNLINILIYWFNNKKYNCILKII